jgi:hypothetical protein
MATIVKQYIDGFLEHPLFIANDNLRRFQINQSFQSIITVDDPSIKIVEIRGGKSTAFKWNQWPQIRW